MIDPPLRPTARQPDNRRFPASPGSFLVGITPASPGSHLVGQDLDGTGVPCRAYNGRSETRTRVSRTIRVVHRRASLAVLASAAYGIRVGRAPCRLTNTGARSVARCLSTPNISLNTKLNSPNCPECGSKKVQHILTTFVAKTPRSLTVRNDGNTDWAKDCFANCSAETNLY